MARVRHRHEWLDLRPIDSARIAEFERELIQERIHCSRWGNDDDALTGVLDDDELELRRSGGDELLAHRNAFGLLSEDIYSETGCRRATSRGAPR